MTTGSGSRSPPLLSCISALKVWFGKMSDKLTAREVLARFKATPTAMFDHPIRSPVFAPQDHWDRFIEWHKARPRGRKARPRGRKAQPRERHAIQAGGGVRPADKGFARERPTVRASGPMGSLYKMGEVTDT